MGNTIDCGTIVKLKNLKIRRLFGHLFVVTRVSDSGEFFQVSPITSMSNWDQDRLSKFGKYKYVIKDWKSAGLKHSSLVSLDTSGDLKVSDYLHSIVNHLSSEDTEGLLKKFGEVHKLNQKVESFSLRGSRLSSDALMLSRYGDVYPGIDNAYHPNTGSKEEGYLEIERVVDWFYLHGISDGISSSLQNWIFVRTAQAINDGLEDPQEIVEEVLCSDIYDPCTKTVSVVEDAINYFELNKEVFKEFLDADVDQFAENIATYLNEKFLRVRIGGKLNPQGEDAIYFRISSHGYDWHRCISNFLWDLNVLPSRMVICHDAETNPPEKILYDGSPKEFLEELDDKVYESLREKLSEGLDNINRDRRSQLMNYRFREMFSHYVSYK